MGLAERIQTESGTILTVHKGRDTENKRKILASSEFDLDSMLDYEKHLFLKHKISEITQSISKYARGDVTIDQDSAREFILRHYHCVKPSENQDNHYKIITGIINGDGPTLIYLDLQKRLYGDVWEAEESVMIHR